MAKFDAGKAVESLEFDFTAFGGPAGIIPEPTSKQVNDFYEGVRLLGKEIVEIRQQFEASEGNAASDGVAAMEAIAGLPDEITKQYGDRMDQLVANLCSHNPSADQIAALPHRVKTAFMAWIAVQINPEGQTPAI